MEEFRPTMAVLQILRVFLDDLNEPQYGFKLMRELNFSSAKTYKILARLTAAKWIERNVDPSASPESGGPPRVTYKLRSEAVPQARRLLNEAHADLTPAREPKRALGRKFAEAMGMA